MSLLISSNLRKEVSKNNVDLSVNYYYQCGTCSYGCPVLRYTKVYNPRRMMENILMGFKESTLKDPILWLYTMCYNDIVGMNSNKFGFKLDYVKVEPFLQKIQHLSLSDKKRKKLSS